MLYNTDTIGDKLQFNFLCFASFFFLLMLHLKWGLKQHHLVTLMICGVSVCACVCVFASLWQSVTPSVWRTAESLLLSQKLTLLQSLVPIPIFPSLPPSLFSFRWPSFSEPCLFLPDCKAAASELYPPRTAEECSLLSRQQHKETVRTSQLAGSQLAESHVSNRIGLKASIMSTIQLP